VYFDASSHRVSVENGSSKKYDAYHADYDSSGDEQQRLRAGKGRVRPWSEGQAPTEPPKRAVVKKSSPHEISAKVDMAVEHIPKLVYSPGQESKIKQLFDCFDTDKSGFICKDEFRALYARIDKMGCEQLNDFDSTIERWAMLKDDLLSYDEFALLMLKIISW